MSNRSLALSARILKVFERRPSSGTRLFGADIPLNRGLETPWSRLTARNVEGSSRPGDRGSETRMAGWGARIRTWEWRNQNPLPYHLATPHDALHFSQEAAGGPYR